MYAWIICLLLLQQCSRTADKASTLPPAHGQACTWMCTPFLASYFLLLISYSLTHLSCPLYVRISSCAKGILLGLGKRKLHQSPPALSEHQAFETGSHELCHLGRVKIQDHPGPFQRLHSLMD